MFYTYSLNNYLKFTQTRQITLVGVICEEVPKPAFELRTLDYVANALQTELSWTNLAGTIQLFATFDSI